MSPEFVHFAITPDNSLAQDAIRLFAEVLLTIPAEELSDIKTCVADNLTGDLYCCSVVEGSAMIAAGTLALEGNRADLSHIAVRPDRQGQGLGRQLVTELEKAAKEAGASRVIIFPVNDDVEAIFEHFGYALAPDDPAVHADYLAKRLM